MHQRFPNDLDAATLYVEAVMDLRPWGYWMRDGTPHEGTADAVALVESVIARNPQHPGALHLYIHLMESVAPEKAEVAADRLLPLMPAAGHMVHMPSHIYQRVGRYADAVKSNQLADRRRRGLHHAVPRAGALSDGLLPAQPALPLVCGDIRRPGRAGDRRRRGRPRRKSTTRP